MNNSTQKLAFIGNGPLNMLKAYLVAKSNPAVSVVIFDSKNLPGGAWYSDISPAGHEIECACHIWSYCPDVYRFIEMELGVKLVPYKPNAVFVGKRMKLPYSTKNSIDTYRYFFKNLLLLRWGALKKIKIHPGLWFRLIGKRNLYPKTGSPELIHALIGKLSALPNVKFENNCHVSKIEAWDEIRLTTGSAVHSFDEVYITSVTDLSEINNPTGTISIKSDRIDYVHFLISLNKPALRKISYWRMMNDEVVHRITDISYQTGNKENLFLVGIKPKAFAEKKETELEPHIRNLFLKHRLIDDSYETSRVKTHVYPTYYIAPEIRSKIAGLHPKLKLLHSTDLMHGFYYVLKEAGAIT